jgi:capsular polysaccharide export protein
MSIGHRPGLRAEGHHAERLVHLRDRPIDSLQLLGRGRVAPAKRLSRRLSQQPRRGGISWFAECSARQRTKRAAADRWARAEAEPIGRRPFRWTGADGDGFIRSRGLELRLLQGPVGHPERSGDKYGATSRTGWNADPGRRTCPEAALGQAGRLRRRIVERGLSKYNLRAGSDQPTDRERLLVVRRVENVGNALGCADIRTNSGLVEAARQNFPEPS